MKKITVATALLLALAAQGCDESDPVQAWERRLVSESLSVSELYDLYENIGTFSVCYNYLEGATAMFYAVRDSLKETSNGTILLGCQKHEPTVEELVHYLMEEEERIMEYASDTPAGAMLYNILSNPYCEVRNSMIWAHK